MSDQDLQKSITQDEERAKKVSFKRLTLIERIKLGFKSFFKKVVLKLKLKFKAYLKRMKKLFIRQEEERIQKSQRTPLEENVHRSIPAVLKDVADLDNKVDLFVQNHHEVGFERSAVNFAIIERIKAEENKKHHVNSGHYVAHHAQDQEYLERKSPIERLSSHSIDVITAEILKQGKIKSFIDRELSRISTGDSSGRAIA